jgi:hypothetical protein
MHNFTLASPPIPNIKFLSKARILKMYSRSAKGGEKGNPNRNSWLTKMGFFIEKVHILRIIFVNAIAHLGHIFLNRFPSGVGLSPRD